LFDISAAPRELDFVLETVGRRKDLQQLGLCQLREQARLAGQILKASLLDHAPRLDYVNAIRLADRAQPVRHDDARSLQPLNALGDDLLRAAVECACSFVE
jgi:hypothetical protein